MNPKQVIEAIRKGYRVWNDYYGQGKHVITSREIVGVTWIILGRDSRHGRYMAFWIYSGGRLSNARYGRHLVYISGRKEANNARHMRRTNFAQ